MADDPDVLDQPIIDHLPNPKLERNDPVETVGVSGHHLLNGHGLIGSFQNTEDDRPSPAVTPQCPVVGTVEKDEDRNDHGHATAQKNHKRAG